VRNWGMAIGMICGGFGMLGIAQALCLLRILIAVGVGGSLAIWNEDKLRGDHDCDDHTSIGVHKVAARRESKPTT
jgi:hypothetical protein